MLFNSWQFLIFLPVVFIVYFLLPKKIRYIWLLIASYFFYAFWNWKLMYLILATTLVSYLAGLFIPKLKKKWQKRLLLIATLVVSLGILIFFKYFDFLASSVVSLINMFNGEARWDSFNLILPIGISFYTFQTLSYVIDIYKEKIEAEKNPLYYALYVSFFPQLVAGPIERPENLLPQIKNQEGMNSDNMAEGLRLMLIGYIKKIVIADLIGVYVNNIFLNIGEANGLTISVGTLLFSIQILCDFGGYSDIARGVAKCFNIDLMVNFDHPYRSESIKEFWKRWHISLSSWLKDYIYIPLGGSRNKHHFMWIFNIFIVFFISGLWHGANWTYVIWGMMHFVLRVAEYYIHKGVVALYDKKGWNYHHKALKILRMILTFSLVSLCWIPFRASNVNDMAIAFTNLFTKWDFSEAYFISFSGFIPFTLFDIGVIVLGIILFNTIDYLPHMTKIVHPSGSVIRKGTYALLSILVIAAFIYLQSRGLASSFIYFQF